MGKNLELTQVWLLNLYVLNLSPTGLAISTSEKLFRVTELSPLLYSLCALSIGGLLAFGLGFSEFLLVSKTSSLTLSIAGIFKVCLVSFCCPLKPILSPLFPFWIALTNEHSTLVNPHEGRAAVFLFRLINGTSIPFFVVVLFPCRRCALCSWLQLWWEIKWVLWTGWDSPCASLAFHYTWE